ncbi:MAG: AI-2E family transporter [Burkholderiales bacterium]|nr:AI-2E family transporter [Anaerolineae bacterium]
MSRLSSNSAANAAAGQSTTRYVIIAIVVIVLLVAIWYVRDILLLGLASIILVVMFTMPVRFFVRHGVRRPIAIIASLTAFVVILLLLAIVALPTLLEQFRTLAAVTIPRGISAFIELWNVTSASKYQYWDIEQQHALFRAPVPFLDFMRPLLLSLQLDDTTVANIVEQIASTLGSIGGSVLPLVGGVASTILSILIVLFLSMYFLADPRMHEEGLIKLFPLWYRDRVREILDRIDLTLRGWLRATLLSMIFVGVGTWLGLAALGIQQAAALGVLAGVLSFIPNFGTLGALIPSLVVGLVQAPENIGWIILVIYGMSFLQSQVVAPLLVSESIQLPAVLVCSQSVPVASAMCRKKSRVSLVA